MGEGLSQPLNAERQRRFSGQFSGRFWCLAIASRLKTSSPIAVCGSVQLEIVLLTRLLRRKPQNPLIHSLIHSLTVLT